jgi:hypothetical protein
MKKQDVDFSAIEDGHKDIHNRLLNWARYVSTNTLSINQPMFSQVKSSRQWDVDPHISIPVDTLDGHVLEKAVFKLPILNRSAIRWYYVGRNSITSQRKEQGLTSEGLALLVRDGRQMLKNILRTS